MPRHPCVLLDIFDTDPNYDTLVEKVTFLNVAKLPQHRYECGMASTDYSLLKLEFHYKILMISFIFLCLNAVSRMSFVTHETENLCRKGLGSIRGYFGLNILRKLNTFV